MKKMCMMTPKKAFPKKLKASSTDVIVNLSFCYRIIEFVSVFTAISDLAVCRKCKLDLSFGQ